MNYFRLKKYDISNGPGIRATIFFSGCKGFNGKHCEGCFNSELWDFKRGHLFDDDTKEKVFELLSDKFCNARLSILGGEPLHQDLDELKKFIIEVRGKFENANIWLWTGHYLGELNEEQLEIVKLCDTVVDGRFEKELADTSLMYRGSSNQTVWSKDNNGKFIKDEKYN